MVGEYSRMAELDVAFSTLISNIKSCALEKANRTDRQTVAAWINKLCESISSETEKRNRNLYAQILLKMLRRSHLKKPFTGKPLPGKLPTIPVYMSDYLDETDYGGGEDGPSLSNEPMWMVANDDSMFLNSFTFESTAKDVGVKKDGRKGIPFKDESEYFRMPEADELELYLSSHERNIENTTTTKSNLKEKSNASNLVDDLERGMKANDDLGAREVGAFGGDDSYLLQRFEDIAKDIRYPVLKQQLRSDDSVLRERDLERKLEVLGKKIEDESSKIQQQQDAMVKNILDRKNNEMSELKMAYQRKISELETVVSSRDETISTLNRKFNEVEKRHGNDMQRLADSIKQKELESKSQKSIRDNELTNKINDLNLEITNLKRSHFETIEKLNDENEKYIARCKEKMATENKKLKDNILKLTENIQIIEELKNNFAQENDNCLAREKDYVASIRQLELEASENKGNLSCLDNEVVQLSNEKQNLEKKIEELENSGLQSERMITALQTKIKEFKSALDSLTSSKQNELKEIKLRSKEKMIDIESTLKKRMTSLENDFKRKETEYIKEISKFAHDNDVSTKEIQLLKEAKCKLLIESKRAIELVKRKCDEKYYEMYEQFNVKMNSLQSSLHVCREKLKLEKENITQSTEHRRKIYVDYKTLTEKTQAKLVAKHNLDLIQLTERIVRQKREHEKKMKGMLPLHVKRELEETIDAMKEQIGFLQSKSDLLQEELTSVSALNQSYRASGLNSSINRLMDSSHIVCE